MRAAARAGFDMAVGRAAHCAPGRPVAVLLEPEGEVEHVLIRRTRTARPFRVKGIGLPQASTHSIVSCQLTCGNNECDPSHTWKCLSRIQFKSDAEGGAVASGERTLRMHAALNSTPLLLLILVADFAITSLHSYQERSGVGAPLWRNFGAIVGLDVPDRWGFPIFTVFLTLALFTIGFIGIMGPLGPGWTAGALGALIGARLSDTLVSHVLLYGMGYRPNPGLSSTPFYLLEAIFIGWTFQAPLTADPGSAMVGLALGALSFIVVLPALRLVRWAIPAWRRPPWRRWQPIPAWASVKPQPSQLAAAAHGDISAG
jgi:hypothetical protein